MKGGIVEKEITNNELLRFMTDQFEKIFIILDTKADKSDFEALSKKVTKIDHNVTETNDTIVGLRMELKSDISELRSEIKSDLMDLKDELKGDIQNLRKDTNQRIFALKRV